jgi:hypothetical protein
MEAPPSVAASILQGVGINRADIQQLYESPSLGFVFEESTPVDGQPRAMGKSSDGLTCVEMIGPSSDLASVSLMVGVPNDAPRSRHETNAVLILSLLKQACPSWSDSSNWLSQNIGEAEKVETIQWASRSAFRTLKH